jgi:hypothetical protein
MDLLALDQAQHHPADSLDMPDISPQILALTQINIQRIIQMGSWSHPGWPGDYEIDNDGLKAAPNLYAKHP